jgi:RNase P/RNase MRP subunit p30
MVYEDESRLKYNCNPKRVDIIVTNFVQREDHGILYKSKMEDNLDLKKEG